MCCGRNKSQAVQIPFQTRTPPQSSPNSAPPFPAPDPQFEYTGKTALTVVSPLTGKKYLFPHPGSRTPVDPRDRPWIAFVPHLNRCV
jgi:hypothetical protein